MKLTSKLAANLAIPDGKKEALYFDELLPGFGLRIRAGGSRVWIYQFKFGDKHRRMTLGRVTALDAETARETAKTLYAKVRLGIDPACEKEEARLAAADTFGALARRYEAYQETRLRPASLIAIRHYLKRAAPLNGLPVDKIDRRRIAELLTDEAERGPVVANRMRGVLSAAFAWGIAEGLCEAKSGYRHHPPG